MKLRDFNTPDRFPDISTANEIVSKFVNDMECGEMLEFVILTHDGEFIGSMEVFGITEKAPELGLWVKSSAHGKGYGYEALRGLIDYLKSTGQYQYYIYEVDVRNTASIHLAEKFHFEKCGYEEITTESGKTLNLQTYHIWG